MAGGEESAGEHNGDVEQALEEMVAGVVGAHGPVVGFFGTQVFLVGFAEFPEFQGFVGEALDHADAFQGVHDGGVDPGDFFPVVREGFFHAFVLDGGKPEHDQGHGGQAQPQLPVDAEHHGEGAENFDERYEQVLRAVVGQFGDVEEIGDNAAGESTGVGAVVEAEGQFLELLKEIPPHVGFHAGAHDVTLAGYVIAAGCFQDVHGEHGGNQPGEAMINRIGSLDEECAGAPAEDQGKGDVHGGDHSGTEQVHEEHAFVGFVERDKVLECLHSSPRFLIIAGGRVPAAQIVSSKRFQV